MSESRRPGHLLLQRMLDRLYAATARGPAMNARPHASRQRIDCMALGRLGDRPASEVVAHLIGGKGRIKLVGKHAPVQCDRPGRPGDPESDPDYDLATELADYAEIADASLRYEAQERVISQLRRIAEDAQSHVNDTGVHSLYIGYPLLAIPPKVSPPPGSSGARILAPLALIPVEMTVIYGMRHIVELEGAGEGEDRVIPNPALTAWIARHTGRRMGEIFSDPEGDDPWREINELVAHVCDALDLPPHATLTGESPLLATPQSEELDRKGVTVHDGAILGLFPLSRQAIVADMEAIVAGEIEIAGPLVGFLDAEIDRVKTSDPSAPLMPMKSPEPDQTRNDRAAADTHLVARADPCQTEAVFQARDRQTLVIHGPPGTGKSQTITNIIGDHIARGERVLFVSDKRTALDVVHKRLDHLGLGELCAIVHDSRRDRAAFYKSIREQLDGLPEVEVPEPLRKLTRLNSELDRASGEVAEYLRQLDQCGHPGVGAFADLVGRRLALSDGIALQEGKSGCEELKLDGVAAAEADIREALARGREIGYPNCPWTLAAGIEMAALKARSVSELRGTYESLCRIALDADRAIVAGTLPFAATDFVAEAAATMSAAQALGVLAQGANSSTLAAWIAASRETQVHAAKELALVENEISALRRAPIDIQLAERLAAQGPRTAVQINEMKMAITDYLRIATTWHAFLHFGVKRAARAALDMLGLPLGATAAETAIAFLDAMQLCFRLWEVHANVVHPVTATANSAVATLASNLETQSRIASLLAANEGLAADLRANASDSLNRLKVHEAAQPRAIAITRLMEAAWGTELYHPRWLDDLLAAQKRHEPVAPRFHALAEHQGELTGVLATRGAVERLPADARPAVQHLLGLGAEPEAGFAAMMAAALDGEIAARLSAHPLLLEVDATRLHALTARIAELETTKRELERDAALAQWRTRQRERLLASTGTRLSSDGAEVKRRTVQRGTRSLSLRRMIELGEGQATGDPLFDLRPVWLASPETVAQVLPRAPIFDALVFDEASQVRLEEAFPLLVRARRVIIAGDPKQLPPTRFFESAVIASEESIEDESRQGMFEVQQSEVEDLLTAALNLQVDHAYLDVHYRSLHPELIAFSNQHFYGARLQTRPIPPATKALPPPIELIQVGGIYDKQRNQKEAEEVVSRLGQLLIAKNPPSVGVACFSLNQVDLISDLIAKRSIEDEKFRIAIERARARAGDDSHEGLFVKNLEAVQGDERDHIIICTTFGKNPEGKFYRRFGPLAMAGGGRRLNVLITRARERIHLLTSIPADVYRGAHEVPAGHLPSGSWYLFAYLRFADDAQQAFTVAQADQEQARSIEPELKVNATRRPSELAQALAERICKRHRVSVELYGGDEGFQVDLTLRDPTEPDTVTLGVLIDAARYGQGEGVAVWDRFKDGLLATSGWRLHRVWSPHFAHDPESAIKSILALHYRRKPEA